MKERKIFYLSPSERNSSEQQNESVILEKSSLCVHMVDQDMTTIKKNFHGKTGIWTFDSMENAKRSSRKRSEGTI